MIERLKHEESGFTLIELLVSAVILVIGVFGLVTSVNTSHKLTDVSEHETVASQVADRELDFALTVPYVAVALTSLPVNGRSTDDGTQWNRWLTSVVPHPSTAFTCSTASSSNNNPTVPNDERSTSCVAACAAADAVTQHAGCPAIGRLAAVSTVSVPGGSSTIRKLKVYRFVTWVNDLACGVNCPNSATFNGYKGDYKRVTVAVLPVQEDVSDTTGVAATQGLGGPTQPVVVSAIRNDPAFSFQNTPASGSPCSVQGIRC